MINNFEKLTEKILNCPKMNLAVVVAEDEEVLIAVGEAAKLNIINPILIGDQNKIVKIANENNIDISRFQIIEELEYSNAAIRAVKLVNEGKAHFIMKGLLETSTLLKAVLNKEFGLRTGNLLSHVMVYECEKYHKLMLLTDGGMNIEPSLEDKAAIIKNAVEVSRALGNKQVKVACLAAKEKVDPKMKATVDGFELQKLGQTEYFGSEVIVEGPLAFDIAISKHAADIKGVNSRVAGDVDILLMPTIEVGNGIGKALTYLSNVKQGGIIMGAKVPVVMVSRSDSHEAKLNSIALGSIIANNK